MATDLGAGQPYRSQIACPGHSGVLQEHMSSDAQMLSVQSRASTIYDHSALEVKLASDVGTNQPHRTPCIRPTEDGVLK